MRHVFSNFRDEEPNDLPWKEKPKIDLAFKFNGFEEADSDNVNELTRVITSNTLYLELVGKKLLEDELTNVHMFFLNLYFQISSQSKYYFQRYQLRRFLI